MTATSAGPAAAPHSVAVQFQELHRWYGAVHALDGFSNDIEPGELVALLGPSGCGKTTALRALGGLDEVDAGSILVDGKEIPRVPANKRNMGIVFQAYSLFPNMTAGDNDAYGLRLRGVGKDERRKRAAETLELVGLGGYANRYPHQMSGGQQHRVALARALAIQPKVLLLDEPLSALDAKVRRQLRPSTVSAVIALIVAAFIDGFLGKMVAGQWKQERMTVATLKGFLTSSLFKSIVRRLLYMIPLFIGISIISFFIMYAAGDPLTIIRVGRPNIDQATIDALRAYYGLDQPIPIQYLNWLSNLLQGNFGKSLYGGRPVNFLIGSWFGETVKLMLSSTLIAFFISIPIRINSAKKQYSAGCCYHISLVVWSFNANILAWAYPDHCFLI